MNPKTMPLVRDAYLHALALDPDNRPARFNLTVLDLHTGGGDDDGDGYDGGDRERLLRTLEELRVRSRRPPGPGLVSDAVRWLRDRIAGVRGAHADPLWWHTTYAIAAEHAHVARAPRHRGERATETALAKAEAVAREGVVAGLRVLGRPAWLRTPIAAFVAEATPPLAVLYAGVASRAMNPDVEPPRTPREMRREARRLSTSLRDGERLVALVRGLPMSPRTRYNLACLYTRFELDDLAMAQFADAAPGLDRELLDWALRDPSLARVEPGVETLVEREVIRRDRVKRAATTGRRPAGGRATRTT